MVPSSSAHRVCSRRPLWSMLRLPRQPAPYASLLLRKVVAGHLVAPSERNDERHARTLPALTRALQGMGVVTPYLPEVRAGGPVEDVEGVTFGEHFRPIPVEGNPVVGAHVVAELVRVEVRGPGPYEAIGGHVAGRAARERGEVRVDLIGKVVSAPLPIFGVDRVIYFVHDEGNLHPIGEMLDRVVCLPVQHSP